MGFLSPYCLTNSIFQYTHYGIWTLTLRKTLKWMQQFHLKVTSRYYNKKQNIFHSWSFLFIRLFLSHTDTLFLPLMKFRQEEISLYVCNASAWEKNMHYLCRKAPSVRLLRELYSEEFERSACHWPEGSCKLWVQFVCCKWRFFESWATPLFSGTRLPRMKDRKAHVLMHRYTNTDMCAHTLAHKYCTVRCNVLEWDV